MAKRLVSAGEALRHSIDTLYMIHHYALRSEMYQHSYMLRTPNIGGTVLHRWFTHA